MRSLLVRNGHIVTESGVLEDADVLVQDGLIAALGWDLTGLGAIDEVVDAEDCYVLPGVIDPHVHTSLDGHSVNEAMAEDLEAASLAGLHGGVTTVGAYVQRIPGRDLLEMIQRQIAFGRAAAWTDFALNALCFPGDDLDAIVLKGSDLGIGTFKVFLSYHNRGLMTEDDDLYRLMARCAERDAVVLVHAENGRIIDHLEAAERQRGEPDRGALLRSAPAEIEAEGMFRAATFARMTGCRLLFVHVTSAAGARMLASLRAQAGRRIAAETQPHYCLLTNDEVLERGGLAKVGPPLKTPEDVVAVRTALGEGVISHLSSDHSPRMREVKLATDNILDAPYGGISGVELLLPLAFRLGLQEGLFDITTLARVTSTNAAKRFGLYPRKGTIRPGADGDLTLVPVDGDERVITPSILHGASDYSLYEGIASRGFPRTVIRNGRLALRDGEVQRVPARHLGYHAAC